MGSGASRGLAHLGVLKVLIREGINIDYLAGTSIGAIIGACFAARADVKELERIGLGLTLHKIINLTIPRKGLIDDEKISSLIRPFIGGKRFKDLEIPLAIIATEIDSNKVKVFTEGEVIQAVQASIAVPGIFEPVIIGDDVFVDGGVKDPVPVEACRKLGADIVIAVDLNHHIMATDIISEIKELDDRADLLLRIKRLVSTNNNVIFDIVGKSIDIMQREITLHRFEKYPPDVIIRPKVGHLHLTDFSKARESISSGEEAANKVVPKIKKLLNSQH